MALIFVAKSVVRLFFDMIMMLG